MARSEQAKLNGAVARRTVAVVVPSSVMPQIFEQGYDKKRRVPQGARRAALPTMLPSAETRDKPVIVRVMCYRRRQAP
ncbi:hypothetical protein GCM10010532_109560 [Dactylosporangium siamense]|uniref:Uncharacterized protein n=1 Tax=Dactylosporangium siamense TaxID=685454 RepID=A0A919PXT9_9ACTN|nr:hypothetical protein Dsi01nite_103530 [Dactylosporangium siamense]